MRTVGAKLHRLVAVAVLALAGMGVAVQAADEPVSTVSAFAADVRCTTIDVSGVGATVQGRVHLLGVPRDPSRPVSESSFRWDLSAKNVELVRESWKYQGAAPGVYVPKYQHEVHNETLGPASIRLLSFDTHSYFVALPLDAAEGQSFPTLAVGTSLESLALRPTGPSSFDPMWGAVPDHYDDVQDLFGGSREGQFKKYPIQAPSLVAARETSSLAFTLTGDMNVTAFDQTFRVQMADGTVREYQSGYHNEGNMAYGSTETRIYRLRLTNASLSLEVDRSRVQINFEDVVANLAGPTSLTSAVGTLRFSGTEHQLRGENLTVSVDSGTIKVSAARAGFSDLWVFRGVLDGTASQIIIGGSAFPATAAAPAGTVDVSPWASAGPWLVSGAVALGLGILWGGVHVARARRPDALLLAAHDAMLHDRYDSAAKHASRALRQIPKNLDASVIRAASLVKLGRHEEAIKFLQAQIEAGVDDQGILQFMQSVSLVHDNRHEEAVDQLERALAKNPDLERELGDTDFWTRLKPTVARTTPVTEDVYGYG